MSLKKSKGNMYPWVTHMHSYLAGECPHKCSYCYVQRGAARISGKFKGDLRFLREELNINYGAGKIIFIEHMNDLFAETVPSGWIDAIIQHCRLYPNNRYVFQTKNPERVVREVIFPPKNLIGTTIETNRDIQSLAPLPKERFQAIRELSREKYRTFITIEPIMDFDIDILSDWIIDVNPEFVNIGADSKKSNLPEPSKDKVLTLINKLKKAQIEIMEKNNLERILTR